MGSWTGSAVSVQQVRGSLVSCSNSLDIPRLSSLKCQSRVHRLLLWSVVGGVSSISKEVRRAVQGPGRGVERDWLQAVQSAALQAAWHLLVILWSFFHFSDTIPRLDGCAREWSRDVACCHGRPSWPAWLP